MGRQVSFYMTSADEVEFLEFLKGTGDVRILPRSASSDREAFETFQEFDERRSRVGHSCFLWNRSISPKPEWERYRNDEEEYYCADSMNSELICTTRCIFEDDTLSCGRLHMDPTGITADAEQIPKGEAFIKWYEKIARWIKRQYTRNEGGDYVSDASLQLLHGGIQFVGYRSSSKAERLKSDT